MLTEAEIQAIIDMDDLILRNLKITQGYYELSRGMKRVIGSRNVNWCTFATHASKTAGQGLRHELMPALLSKALHRMAGHEDVAAFLEQSRSVGGTRPTLFTNLLQRISHSVAEGNCKVFAELAPPFHDMVIQFKRAWVYDETALAAFLQKHFQPGPTSQGGQSNLIEAFTAYYQARFETNRKRKAELILQANVLVGLHEQTRLQPYIADALTAPVELLLDSPAAYRRSGAYVRALVADLSRRFMAIFATQTMMVIALPWGKMMLGEDVPYPLEGSRFPQDLITVCRPDLQELIDIWDPQIHTVTGSGADNWANLTERMAFIVKLFRCHQQNEQLFERPFTLHQTTKISGGQTPTLVYGL
ncbi:MAG: hypothetical protein AAF614_00395 [Chloroflexota bacterium]